MNTFLKIPLFSVKYLLADELRAQPPENTIFSESLSFLTSSKNSSKIIFCHKFFELRMPYLF